MFSTNFSKICCSLAQNKILEKSNMADICCETTVAIASVLD